jgi:CBS domain-containing protein
MLDNNISPLVISANNIDNRNSTVLKGIITKSDLLDAYVKSYGGNVTVNQYMTKKMQTVRPDEPVHMVLLIMPFIESTFVV